MKNTFGNSINLTIFGESHGPAIGTVLTGMAPGIEIDLDFIKNRLAMRAPQAQISTARQEKDAFQILSGVFEGKTTGAPITIIIPNQDVKSKDYQKSLLRPGHVDYAAYAKYHGFQDWRGGGHFSGRITASLVAACSICEKVLLDKNIIIASHIKECAGISDSDMLSLFEKDNAFELLNALNQQYFATIDSVKGEQMQAAILKAKSEKDSVGGILETVILGLEAGIGEPWFDSLESQLSHALFSVPAVKGVAFGDGFNFAKLKGSEANDSPMIKEVISQSKPGQMESKQDPINSIGFASNHNGGINGGISNGMPIVFSTAIKPTPSIAREQKTVDIETLQAANLEIKGRHDPAIIHRIRQVINSISAFVICDFLALRHGTDYLANKNE